MKIKILANVWLFIGIVTSGIVYADPVLTMIDVAEKKSSTRVEFLVTEPTKYTYKLNPQHRLVIDFKETALAANLGQVKFKDTVLQTVRGEYPNAETLRLVFTLKPDVKWAVFSEGNKIILDVRSKKENVQENMNSFEQKKAWVVNASNRVLNKPLIIVIDPGHGGKDVGASGDDGTKEKNVVLAISRRLATLINRQPNMRAELTREGDEFVPLRGRLKLAHKGKADLFIAIHADSYFDSRASGASVYALSQRGATSEAARWLAKRDNYSELGGVDLGDLDDKSYVLRSVLLDLAQTATITDSLRLGNVLLGSLKNVAKLHYSRVEQAPFVVLKSPDIPSVLVEVGFLSNPKEEKKLRDTAYQDRIANALFNGIHTYLKKYSVTKV